LPDRRTILIVDDHREMARLLSDQLRDSGYETMIAVGGREAVAALRARVPDLVITDLRMEAVDGFDVIDAVKDADPEVPVIIMTAFGAIETAVEAMRRGAYHYVTKPFRLDEVLVLLARALADGRMRRENRSLRRLAAERSAGAMVGTSPRMRQLVELIERVAPSRAPVLVRGESGTGKELVARAIHDRGERRSGPFVAVNCTAIPGQLLESELFGHVRGAFTGATAARGGLFVEADGGTLLLDEIGDMSVELQAKVLRVVEDGEVRPVGADGVRRVDVRVIASTHRMIEELVAEGSFRADLFYRLNVVALLVPPLRERVEDIPVLAEHFLAQARARNPGSPARRMAPELCQALARAPWPGNVRELENLVERLVIVAGGATLALSDLENHAPQLLHAASPVQAARNELVTLRQLEDDYIAWVLSRCEGNKTRAAEILGVDVSTIHRRMRPPSQ
jgi:two-component system response regulator HydG